MISENHLVFKFSLFELETAITGNNVSTEDAKLAVEIWKLGNLENQTEHIWVRGKFLFFLYPFIKKYENFLPNFWIRLKVFIRFRRTV